MVKEIHDKDFKEQVLGSTADIVIVDFWASWCAPCKEMAPVLDKVSEMFDGHVKICKINVEENPLIASEYGVRGLPTLIFFQDGKPAVQKTGRSTEKMIVNRIHELMGY